MKIINFNDYRKRKQEEEAERIKREQEYFEKLFWEFYEDLERQNIPKGKERN